MFQVRQFRRGVYDRAPPDLFPRGKAPGPFCAGRPLIISAAVSHAADRIPCPEFDGLSFTYGGRPSTHEIFSRTATPAGENSVFEQKNIVYFSSDGKLRIDVEYRFCRQFPVSEYTVHPTSVSPDGKTGLIEDFQSIGTSFYPPAVGQNLIRDTVTGSRCAAGDFRPKRRHEW